MALTPGTRLGVYEILTPLGVGGMGEVYKARDTRLDRTVAIKILPEAHAADPQFRDRFDREARSISQLDHAHICALYDVGQQDGTAYLVMQYLEGETLADRLIKGALPLDQALQIAIQIADALATAHKAGIVHRDLKPANIMLTKAGAKLLDFGLAKSGASALGGMNLSMLPTTPPITQQGAILGTFQYMAPEQLEGHEADARTDIFAFGAVVYEMLTGKKAFEGKSQASLIAAILEHEPTPVSTVQPLAPLILDRVVKKCLAKDPGDRWQTARDLWDELRWILGDSSRHDATASVASLQAQAAVPPRVKASLPIAWATVATAVTAVVALSWYNYFLRTPVERQAVRFSIAPPEGWSLTIAPKPNQASPAPLAVSPDGLRIAFGATGADGKDLLWVRALDSLTAQSLPGTEGAVSPFWSPDSRSLGFFADGKLKRIDVLGGPPITLCDAPVNVGGTWSQDGVIVFAVFSGKGPARGVLQKVSAAGGVPTAASTLGAGETGHYRPSFLPDGRHFLFSAAGGGGASGAPIYVGSLDSSTRTLVMHTGSTNVRYAQGHLLFLREQTLMAQPFDPRRLALSGDPVPVAEQIQASGNSAPPLGVFSVSDTGVLAFQTGFARSDPELAWFDRQGQRLGSLGDRAAYSDVSLSPDSNRAAVTFSTPGQLQSHNLWVFDIARGFRARFTFDVGVTYSPVWSPNGDRIAFTSNRQGHMDLYQRASIGAGGDELLLADTFNKYPTGWSPDQRHLVYTIPSSTSATKSDDVWALPLFGDRKPFPLLQTRFNEASGVISPDGHWLAYASDEAGMSEVFVVPFLVKEQPPAQPVGDTPLGKWQISVGGGEAPRWRADGHEILYLTPTSLGAQLKAASVNSTRTDFHVGTVQSLFPFSLPSTAIVGLQNTTGMPYDVSRDGQRLLIIARGEPSTTLPPMTVMINWPATLKK